MEKEKYTGSDPLITGKDESEEPTNAHWFNTGGQFESGYAPDKAKNNIETHDSGKPA